MKLNMILKQTAAGILVFAVGIVLLVIGIRNGECQVVLEKAINICMECIGIG